MLSLIVWLLVLVVAVKYIVFIMRADNRGEGGILALMALILQQERRSTDSRRRWILIVLGLFGAALLYGDGIITPSITVLGAVEGLSVATPAFSHTVVPISLGILHLLFTVQRVGTGRIGTLFGPIMALWFVTIAALGAAAIVRQPEILGALNPWHGVTFFIANGRFAFLALGAVVLAVTGAEALYADMGHFGPRAIRISWYGLVLPALVLNYAGQTAIILEQPLPAGANPFYELCPSALQLPLVVLATLATIIASQAIISGAFSMTRQAIQLGLCPRLHIKQTSAEGYGQIYVGFVNWSLMALTLALTLAFRTSDNLAAAYGIAVSLTMLLTSLLIFLAMREVWRWSLQASLAAAGAFVVVDLSFVVANLMKVLEGGWVPLVVAAILFFLMSVWREGRAAMLAKLERDTLPLADFIAHNQAKARVPGTAIYMTSRTDVVPVPLLHNLKHNKVLHQRIVLLHVATASVPRIAPSKRLEVSHLGHEFHAVAVRYGFMEQPHVPRALDRCADHALGFEMMDTSFFVGRLTIVAVGKSRWKRIKVAVFEAMHRNAQPATEFFRIPANRVVELGGQLEI